MGKLHGNFQSSGKLVGGQIPLAEANLREADLGWAILSTANLWDADLRWANVRAVVFAAAGTNDVGAAEYMDLSIIHRLTQNQLDVMLGDSGTILPDGLERPAHWPRYVLAIETGEQPPEPGPPSLPPEPKGNRVDLKEVRLALGADEPVPTRSDLETLFLDLLDAIEDLTASGGLHNLSPLLAKGLDRLLAQIPETYVDIEQVRFGASTEMLRLRFSAERKAQEQVAPEKVGHIEAVLYVSDLIAARLPEWKAFLDEEEDDAAVFEAKKDEARQVLEDAADALARSPETFDPSLFGRVRKYLEDAGILGYLAAKDLLLSIAHKTFSLCLELTKETGSTMRKEVIKSIARVLLVELGATFAHLAGMLPNELAWLVRWLDDLPGLLQ